MPKRTCSIDGCENPAKSRGWCGKHYQRWQVHGDPHLGGPTPVEIRFWEKVDKSGDCWVWTAGKDHRGYGRFKVGGRDGQAVGAHRVSWTLTTGEDPGDICVLHRCDNPPCVNPDHLFLGTRADNVQDMVEKGRHWLHGRTHCKRGHEFTDSNTIIRKSGKRQCRTCANERRRI